MNKKTVITRTTQYFNKIQKNSNSEQHFDCFIEHTFRLDCSHHQDSNPGDDYNLVKM